MTEQTDSPEQTLNPDPGINIPAFGRPPLNLVGEPPEDDDRTRIIGKRPPQAHTIALRAADALLAGQINAEQAEQVMALLTLADRLSAAKGE